MKYAPLVLKHLRKNWIRTLSTVLAMSVCILLFCTLHTVVEAVNFGLHAGNAGRLVTRNNVSLVFNLPINYKARVAAVPGVKEVVANAWFGGIYRDPKNFFANFATEPEKFLEIYPEIMLPPDQKESWLHDRRGCIIGRKLAQRFGWKVGDTFELESLIPPYSVGHPFDFVVDGIYDTDERKYPGTDLQSMYFDYKYLYEATSAAHRHRLADGEDRRSRATRAPSAKRSTRSSTTVTTKPRRKPSRRSSPALSRWPATWRCC